jgi:hypothetical protein
LFFSILLFLFITGARARGPPPPRPPPAPPPPAATPNGYNISETALTAVAGDGDATKG